MSIRWGLFSKSGRERTGVSSFLLTFVAVMIVANMNLHQVYADLTGELKKLDWKRDTLKKKAVTALRKSEVYPACVTYDYRQRDAIFLERIKDLENLD
jgi:hypothetical protein